jgi:hypothetical protein
MIVLKSGAQWLARFATMLAIAFGGQANADIITWDINGQITQVIDPSGVLAANNPTLGVGSTFSLTFSFDYSLSPTFPNPFGPGGGVTSWWGTGHSSMLLSLGNSTWQTVGPERVDAVYFNPPPAVGPLEQIDSDHWDGSMQTDVDPGFTVASGDYHLNWTLINSTSFLEPNLSPDNFPLSLDPANWDYNLMSLDVTQTGSSGQSASYGLRGTLLTAVTVPEPSTLAFLVLPFLALVAGRRCSEAQRLLREWDAAHPAAER